MNEGLCQMDECDLADMLVGSLQYGDRVSVRGVIGTFIRYSVGGEGVYVEFKFQDGLKTHQLRYVPLSSVKRVWGNDAQI